MYPRIPWEMVAAPKGSLEHTLETAWLWCSLGKPAHHNIQWRDQSDDLLKAVTTYNKNGESKADPLHDIRGMRTVWGLEV